MQTRDDLNLARDRTAELENALECWIQGDAALNRKIAALQEQIAMLYRDLENHANCEADRLDRCIPGWRALITTEIDRNAKV